MATNLRLDSTTAERLRVHAKRLGRSQQSIIRDALHSFLDQRDALDDAHEADIRELAAFGAVFTPPPRPERKTGPTNDPEWNALIASGYLTMPDKLQPGDEDVFLKLPEGVTSQQLIDEEREERF